MKHPSERNTQKDSNDLNTKKAAKRRKWRYKGTGIRKPNTVGLIYQKVNRYTMAQIADEATEKRLSRTGPPQTARTSDDVIYY